MSSQNPEPVTEILKLFIKDQSHPIFKLIHLIFSSDLKDAPDNCVPSSETEAEQKITVAEANRNKALLKVAEANKKVLEATAQKNKAIQEVADSRKIVSEIITLRSDACQELAEAYKQVTFSQVKVNEIQRKIEEQQNIGTDAIHKVSEAERMIARALILKFEADKLFNASQTMIDAAQYQSQLAE
jgi:hypothetical protein